MDRSITPERLTSELTGKYLLDVRRPSDLATSTEQLPNAIWHDPRDIENWSKTLTTGQDIVLYCVRGGSVSNSVIDALHAKGFKARYIEGGIEGWKAAGGAIVLK
ncbi:Rhodanese-like protein [Gammaproteobacteria bacterium]